MYPAPVFHKPVFHISAASALALVALLFAPTPSRAQETFICEDGGSVTVLPGQLELMKRTDPCVARHFAPSPEPGAPDAQVVPAPAPTLAPAEAPLPERKPDTFMADFAPGLIASEPLADAARAAKPVAEVKSDYRHVHIINARPGAPQFYEHAR